MSYIQPENANRVNAIKQKFEKNPESNVPEKSKCPDEVKKESLRRSLSASPIKTRKSLKLNVGRQLSNPGRNIKRSPAFRGDKNVRIKNLNSPTKEKLVSIVDKNVKLFEDKPEYGKIGNVKKKLRDAPIDKFGILYDDVKFVDKSRESASRLNFTAGSEDDPKYGKILKKEVQGSSRDIDRRDRDWRNVRLLAKGGKTCKDSVRTTVISRQKNISPVYSTTDEIDAVRIGPARSELGEEQESGNQILQSPEQTNKFLKNGVEYTKVVKVKSKSLEDRSIECNLNENHFANEPDPLNIKAEQYDGKLDALPKRYSSPSKSKLYDRLNINKDIEYVPRSTRSDEDDGIVDAVDGLSPRKTNFHRDSSSRKSSSFSEVEESLGIKLTDTLKAALKAPLPAGPPPKKPPRTFAHSPVIDRSPIDDCNEINVFGRKQDCHSPKSPLETSTVPDNSGLLRSFLHGSKKEIFGKFEESTDNNARVGSENSDKGNNTSFLYRSGFEQRHSEGDRRCAKQTDIPKSVADDRVDNTSKRKTSPRSGGRGMSEEPISSEDIDEDYEEDYEDDYEPIAETSVLKPTSTRKTNSGTNLKRDSEIKRTNFSKPGLSESTSSEEGANSSEANVSYSPRKFRSSPAASEDTAKCRTPRDSKKMLERLENVLIQHQKALGPKVIMPRTDRFESRVTSSSRTESERGSDCDALKRREAFQKRLSRTLEDSKKLGPLPKIPDSPGRKSSTFDCLPSLNCVSSSIYEQIKSPDFKTYLMESKDPSLNKSENFYSKSTGIERNSQFYLDSGTRETYDRLLASPTSKRLSVELSTFLEEHKQKPAISSGEEHVYAEPFAFDKNSGTDITGYGRLSPAKQRDWAFKKQDETFDIKEDEEEGDQLHYMCTPIPSMIVENNNNESGRECGNSKSRQEHFRAKKSLLKLPNLARTTPDKFDKTKVEQLLHQAFGQPVMAGLETPTDSSTSSDTDSLASTTSLSEEILTFKEALQLFKNRETTFTPTKEELHRSLTEKRKHYVRKVSSRYSEKRGGLVSDRRGKLFEVCLLVELNLSTKKPYVKDKYPVYAHTPAWIENFCFPDAADWPPLDLDHNQVYSLVLTDEKGNRRHGYCCRVKPEGGPVLPLAYCIITKHRASGFYYKVLHELESRHGLPDRQRRNFMEELYNTPVPPPGHGLQIKSDAIEESDNRSSSSSNNNTIVTNFTDSHGKTYIVSSPTHNPSCTFLDSERSNVDKVTSTLNNLDLEDSIILRSGDPRLEERDMSQLFDTVSDKVLLLLFGSLLLERKVVLTCDKLSKLSSCVEALQSLLYPFNWPHTFIPVLPNIPGLPEILQAPLPFVIGILRPKNSPGTEINGFEDGIIVDLDTSRVKYAVGDESSIIPSKLQKGLRSALHVVSNDTRSSEGIRNFLVSEAFLRVFVETCAHCDSHIVTQQDGKVIFEKEYFINATGKSTQYFLEWFVETTMFDQFIQDRILRREGLLSSDEDNMKLFDQRIAEYRKSAGKNAQTKRANKKRTLGDRFKDFANFN